MRALLAALAVSLLCSTSAFAQENLEPVFRIQLPQPILLGSSPSNPGYEIELLETVSVVEGTPFSVQASTDNPTPEWTLIDAPTWLAIDANGLVSGAPGNVDVATSYTVGISAGTGLETPLVINVTPGVATIAGLPTSAIAPGTTFSGQAHTSIPGAAFALASPVSGVAINAQNGAISGTMPTGVTGPLSITVVASRNGANAYSATSTVTPAYSVAPLSSFSVIEGSIVSAQATTNMPSPSWTLTGAPSWLSIDPTTGIISGTSTDVSANVTYPMQVSAGSGVSTSFSMTITAGTVSVTGLPTSAQVGGSITGQATSTLTGATFSLVAPPNGVSINAQTGAISGTVPANHNGVLSISVTATKGVARASASRSITVIEPASAATTLPSSVKGYGSSTELRNALYDNSAQTFIPDSVVQSVTRYHFLFDEPVTVDCAIHRSTIDYGTVNQYGIRVYASGTSVPPNVLSYYRTLEISVPITPTTGSDIIVRFSHVINVSTLRLGKLNSSGTCIAPTL